MDTILKIVDVALEPFQQKRKDGSVVLKRAINTERGAIFVTEDKLQQICKAQGISVESLISAPQEYSLSLTDAEFRQKGKKYTYTDANGVSHETEVQKSDTVLASKFRFRVTGMNAMLVNQIASQFAASLGMSFKPAAATSSASTQAAVVEETPEIAIDDVE